MQFSIYSLTRWNHCHCHLSVHVKSTNLKSTNTLLKAFLPDFTKMNMNMVYSIMEACLQRYGPVPIIIFNFLLHCMHLSGMYIYLSNTLPCHVIVNSGTEEKTPAQTQDNISCSKFTCQWLRCSLPTCYSCSKCASRRNCSQQQQ